MNLFVYIMEKIIEFFKYEFFIYGYPLSFWDVIMWSLAAGVLIKIVSGFFD